jgi:hypothetical protein
VQSDACINYAESREKSNEIQRIGTAEEYKINHVKPGYINIDISSQTFN